MSNIAAIVADNLDVWTSAVERKSNSGRGSSKKSNLYGIDRLRSLILDLAVRGKLVPQYADLEQPENLPEINHFLPIADAERFVVIPDTWRWYRLGFITTKIGSGSTPRGGKKAYIDKGVPFLRSQNVWNDGLRVGDVARIPHETHERMQSTKVKPNDLLYNITGASIGRCAIVPSDFETANVSQHVSIIRATRPDWRHYLHIALISRALQARMMDDQVGMSREGLSKKKLEQFPIPIPPLAEQKRIVAKVDELMALCDALEQESEDALTAHQTLVETLLATLVNSTDAADLAKNWARLEKHFETLFTTEPSIDALKQTILDLAVRGKLVEQHASKDAGFGGLKQIKDDLPFANPTGWRWVPFSELAAFKNGDRSSKYPKRSEYVSEGMPWINTGHIQPDGTLSESTMFFISAEKFASLGGGKIQSGDLVYCLRGATFGKTAFVEPYEQGAIASSLMIIRPGPHLDRRYAYIFLISPFGKGQLKRFDNGTAQPNLSAANVKKYQIPLPSLAEQHRIVAKVDELMALCEQLKSGLADATETQCRLADAVVERAAA